VTLTNLYNIGYVKTSSAFTLRLYAVSGGADYNIAEYTSLTAASTLFTTGAITSFTMTATSLVVQESVSYSITMRPSSAMPTDSKIKVTFPSSISLTDTTSCTVTSSGGVIAPVGCAVATNVLTLTNPFGTGSFAKSAAAFTFSLNSAGTNPDSVRDAGSFHVQTFAIFSGSDYAIDDTSFSTVYTPTLKALTATVASSSMVTYASGSTYTFSITPQTTIPIDGSIKIVFPSEVTVTSLSACTVTIAGTTSSPTCTLSADTTYVVITGAFTADYLTTTTAFTVALTGFRNPRTTVATSTFAVTTYDEDGFGIGSLTTGIYLTMTT